MLFDYIRWNALLLRGVRCSVVLRSLYADTLPVVPLLRYLVPLRLAGAALLATWVRCRFTTLRWYGTFGTITILFVTFVVAVTGACVRYLLAVVVVAIAFVGVHGTVPAVTNYGYVTTSRAYHVTIHAYRCWVRSSPFFTTERSRLERSAFPLPAEHFDCDLLPLFSATTFLITHHLF